MSCDKKKGNTIDFQVKLVCLLKLYSGFWKINL